MLWQALPLLLVAQKNFIYKKFYVTSKVSTSEEIKGQLCCLEWIHSFMDDLSVLLFQNDFSPNLSFCLLPPLFDLHFWISAESVKNNSQDT